MERGWGLCGVGALGGEKGAGVICVCGCAKTQKSCYLYYLTPEYNRPKMVAVMHEEIHDTEKKLTDTK